jgi:hypothetical protein
MKTSFDLSQPLLAEVKALARERGTTTKSLVEQALRKLLDDAAQATAPFKLRDLSVGEVGSTTPEYERMTWDQIRDEIYEPSPPFGTRGE